MKKLVNYCMLSALSCLLFIACNNDKLYSHFESIKNESWAYTDTLTYKINIAQEAKPYASILSVRHSDNYRYQNLWLDVFYGDGQKERLEIELANLSGNWLGKKSGSLHTFQTTLNPAIVNQSDTIQIVQVMRDNPLLGISSVGLELK